MESQLEKEARFCQLMAHSSHDSAIDTDSLEWETEVVEFEKDRVRIEQSKAVKLKALRNNILILQVWKISGNIYINVFQPRKSI